MAVTYSIDSDYLLWSTKAKALSDELRADQIAFAAQLLGVDETEYTGDDLDKVIRAIVLQVNYYLSLKPDMFVYQSESSAHSKQSVTYRTNPALIYPFALSLINSLTSGSATGYGNIKAVR